MARRRSFRFLAAAVSGQSHQREQGHWQRSAAHQQSDQYRLEDGGQHLAAKQNLSGSTIPSIPNQVGGAHRDQGHGRQAGPLGLPHAALRDEIRGPRSSLLRASTPRVTDQAPQGQSRKARIPSHPNTGGGLTRRSFWRDKDDKGPFIGVDRHTVYYFRLLRKFRESRLEKRTGSGEGVGCASQYLSRCRASACAFRTVGRTDKAASLAL